MLYEINNLECRYAKGQTVLIVPKLQIPANKIIFVLGVSGGGKSTLLETLALMNNTIHTGEVLFHHDQNTYNLKTLWTDTGSKSQQEIAAFRAAHFSFIFQTTNLMPNFTAGENMCIGQLMNGASFKSAKDMAFSIMEKLFQEEKESLDVIFEKNVQMLSGGQRQRVAFIRAMLSPHTVLFGDEPTGNLDQFISNKLMDFLVDTRERKSCLIVSHNIQLALAKADEIIILTYNKEKELGEILPENILIKENEWQKGLDKNRWNQTYIEHKLRAQETQIHDSEAHL